MTLLEALNNCSVENLDTTELWYDGDEEAVDYFFSALNYLVGEEIVEEAKSLEFNDELIKEIEEGDSDIRLYEIVVAAMFANRCLYANELDEDDLGDLSQDEAKYEIYLGGHQFIYETDIDLT